MRLPVTTGVIENGQPESLLTDRVDERLLADDDGHSESGADRSGKLPSFRSASRGRRSPSSSSPPPPSSPPSPPSSSPPPPSSPSSPGPAQPASPTPSKHTLVLRMNVRRSEPSLECCMVDGSSPALVKIASDAGSAVWAATYSDVSNGSPGASRERRIALPVTSVVMPTSPARIASTTET